jgi:hypothetical protein
MKVHVRPRLPHGPRGHRVEAARLPISLGPLEMMDEDQESERPGDPPRARVVVVKAGSATGGKPDETRGTAARPLLADFVAKVAVKRLWNRKVQQSNQIGAMLDSTLRIDA